MALTKTKIEYLDYCWNFYPGCLNGCSYCWAHKRAIRFNKGDFEPRLRADLLLDPLKVKKPARIGVCFTGDLFGDWLNPEQPNCLVGYDQDGSWWGNMNLQDTISCVVRACPQHTFVFLTKCPQNLFRWSPYPSNCYIGASVTNQEMHNRAIACLSGIKASMKFISYEPLLDEINFSGAYDLSEIQWVILGQQTPIKKATMPKIEWINEIIEAADKAQIPVFLKNNLSELLKIREVEDWRTHIPFYRVGQLRQEFPLVSI